MPAKLVWTSGMLIILHISSAACRQVAADAAPAGTAQRLGRVGANSLREISGLAASRRHPDILWLHEDGDVREILAVNTSGEVVAEVRLPDKARDAEDMAIGPGPAQQVDFLYLADIGDNDLQRPFVRVFRLLEPDLQQVNSEKIRIDQIDQFRFTYPDGPIDAEGLMVDPTSGDLLIVSKEKSAARVFLAPADQLKPGATVMLRELCRPAANTVSAGDISRDGRRIALRNEDRGWLWERRPGEPIEAALRRTPQLLEVRGADQARNGEAIALHPSGNSYFTISEGRREFLYQFPLPPVSTR